MDALFYLDGVDGQLEVYETKIVISRKGTVARSIHGKSGNKTIPLNSIKYITLRDWTIWKRGEIGFGLNSAPSKVNSFDSNKNRENCIILTKANTELAKKIKTYIENRILAFEEQQSTPVIIDVADEILKYKNLFDIGAITQEEFELKKKQLLDIN